MGINSLQPPEDPRSADPVCPATFTMFTTFTGPIMMLMIAVTDYDASLPMPPSEAQSDLPRTRSSFTSGGAEDSTEIRFQLS
jgi:hypothetical protein